MENNMKEELERKRKAAWTAFGPLKEATDQMTKCSYNDTQMVTIVSIKDPFRWPSAISTLQKQLV
ncbi:hypothetical protein KIN20_001705 [Parelaphostrongylus tenuis]|uniref:Uncharacterized protein n=1 Tax=Parelaphostrongylus tenuis TaxID=148309 RepID=A0AAD5MD72_PARTN|nr:hypothetical protein KIN20_001705 [Parelaphostrongylus tenuis]